MAAWHGPLRLIWRFVVPMLLLVISVHAVMPLGQPAQRAAGSAFSAETADVTLRSGQRAGLVKQAEVPRPPATVAERAAILPAALPVPAPEAKPAVPGLGATGPPPTAGTGFAPFPPRAPPAA